MAGSSAKNWDIFRPTCRADSVPIPGVFVVDSCLPFVVYATNSPVNQKYLTVIYSCIYNNQPTNNTFVYFPNKCLYQASPFSLPFSPLSLPSSLHNIWCLPCKPNPINHYILCALFPSYLRFTGFFLRPFTFLPLPRLCTFAIFMRCDYSPFCTSFFLFGRIYQFFPSVFMHIF